MKWLRIIPGFLIVSLILLGAPELITLPFVLLAGWWPAAKRLAANSPFTPLELTIFSLGCLLLVAGFHWFVRRLAAWKFRWSFALTGTGALVLLSIMCVVGVAHQLGWILLSSEPVLVSRRSPWAREHVDLMNTARVMARIAPTDGPWEVATLLRDNQLPDTMDGNRPWEKYHALSLSSTGEHRAAIWPRDEGIRAQLGVALINAEGDISLQRTNDISRLLTAQSHAK